MPRSRFDRPRAAAALTVLGSLLCAERAEAFCREFTASPPTNYDPATDGCYSPSLPPLFWRNQCVGYSLQSNASKYVSLNDATAVAASAFNAWSTASCPGGGNPSIFAQSFPPVDCSEVPSQGHNNPIIFRDNGWPWSDRSNALGYTTLTVDLRTGEILGATIEINSANFVIVVADPIPPKAYDLSSVLTHEAGHFLGLAHSEQSSAVMYAFYKAGSTTLASDDVAGICSIYAPDGSRSTQGGTFASTTCAPQPPGGFRLDCGSLDAGISSGAQTTGPADAGMMCVTTMTCSVGRGVRGGLASLVAAAVMAVGAIARRARRASRGRAALGGAVLSGAMLLAGATVVREAKAAVSVSVRFDELLERASAAAVVVPTEQNAVWEDGRIVTYTHVRLERLVAGRLPGDLWVRTFGGAVGNIGQLVEGEATFAIGRPSLVFVRPAVDPATRSPTGAFGVVEGAQGQYPIVAGEGRRPPRLAVARDLGALIPPKSAGSEPPPAATRLAQDVLRDRLLDDAVRVIESAWPQTHVVSSSARP